LLSVLVENRGEVVPKDELIGRVWADSFVEDAVLTQNIYLLRKTLKANGIGNLIRNVPRRGYVFEPPAFVNETIIERRLVERVEIEEVEDIPHPVKKPNQQTAPIVAAKPSVRLAAILCTSAAAVVIVAGLFLYAGREEGSQRAISPALPLKLNPSTAVSGLKSLAVLEFESADSGFARTFTADLSIRLGSMNKFSVVPPTLTDEYQKHGGVLKTDFALWGDVEINGDNYKANVELIETDGGAAAVWSETFEYDNLIQLQDAVANRTAKALIGRLSDSERAQIATRLPTNAVAYEQFQTARTLWRRRVDGSWYAVRAIEMDANFAPAYALLANIRATAGVKDSPAAKEAEQLLKKAFELDESLADAYAVQGLIRIFHHRDWPGAEASLKTALALDPNSVNAHHWLGVYYSIHRRLDEAKAEMHKALEIDPTNPTLLADIGQLHYFAGENDLAMEHCRKALAVDPDHPFAAQYVNLIRQPHETSNVDPIIAGLRRSFDENSFTLPYINADPRYDHIRDHPEFRAILVKMNLENSGG